MPFGGDDDAIGMLAPAPLIAAKLTGHQIEGGNAGQVGALMNVGATWHHAIVQAGKVDESDFIGDSIAKLRDQRSVHGKDDVRAIALIPRKEVLAGLGEDRHPVFRLEA